MDFLMLYKQKKNLGFLVVNQENETYPVSTKGTPEYRSEFNQISR